jgi:hypothetical protein
MRFHKAQLTLDLGRDGLTRRDGGAAMLALGSRRPPREVSG